jgi:hypothetical protein
MATATAATAAPTTATNDTENTLETTTMSQRNVKRPTIWSLATAGLLGAAVAAAGGGGCKSNDSRDEDVDISADLVEQNRLLVRLALAENVYNGIAHERAVYPDDFEAGTAQLNRLGQQRVEMLIDASRNSTQPVAVLRGGADDQLYAARVDAVREELIDGGIQADAITIAKDTHVGGRGQSGDRALLSYDRLMAGYAADAQDGDGGMDRERESTGSNTRNTSSNTRGQ